MVVKKKKRKDLKKKNTFLEIIKYLSSGALGMTTDVGLLYLLAEVFLINVLISNSIATVASTTLNFIIQKIWAFRSKAAVGRSFAKYASVWFFNYLFTMFFLLIMVENFGFPAGWMKLSTYGFITIWNYFFYKYYVYQK